MTRVILGASVIQSLNVLQISHDVNCGASRMDRLSQIFIDRIALAKQGDDVLGRVYLSVHPSMDTLTAEQHRVQQRTKSHNHKSKVFVCVSVMC